MSKLRMNAKNTLPHRNLLHGQFVHSPKFFGTPKIETFARMETRLGETGRDRDPREASASLFHSP